MEKYKALLLHGEIVSCRQGITNRRLHIYIECAANITPMVLLDSGAIRRRLLGLLSRPPGKIKTVGNSKDCCDLDRLLSIRMASAP